VTYQESADLMTDATFRGRVKVSVLKFADSILNEEPSVVAHNTRMKWANQAMQNPDMTAMSIQQPTVMDAAVQSAGAQITDNALQSAVEATILKQL